MMTDTSTGVRGHYRTASIIQRLEKALAEAGQDPRRLTAEILYPYDQFHGRGIAATKDNTTMLGLNAAMRVLDVGSGVGGPARYMAKTYGCTVTGIDLTDEFVTAAIELTERCGLADKVAVRQGNALAMPFADASFDAACCFNVAMNIADKAGLAREIRRVLKPKGRVVWTEAAQGPVGPPHYPLPWARSPDISHLVPAADLRRAFEAAPLSIVEWIDETRATNAAFEQAAKNPQAATTTMVANGVLLGEDFAERLKNAGRSFREGRTVPVLVLAERSHE
jgi:ubiquinone/menaquinone biosynthesis C-methylase UbiE